jgi:hypothetical protein
MFNEERNFWGSNFKRKFLALLLEVTQQFTSDSNNENE